MMLLIDTNLDSTRQQESVCFAIAIGLHALLLLLNPAFLTSHYKPIHDFVTIDIVDQPAPGGYQQPEAPKKMSLMDTLKDMLMKLKTEYIEQIAGGNSSVIPIAVGNRTAKEALGYSGATLKDSGAHRGINPSALSGPAGEMNSLGGGGPSNIQLSGTGGTGNAPTGATRGSVL